MAARPLGTPSLTPNWSAPPTRVAAPLVVFTGVQGVNTSPHHIQRSADDGQAPGDSLAHVKAGRQRSHLSRRAAVRIHGVQDVSGLPHHIQRVADDGEAVGGTFSGKCGYCTNATKAAIEHNSRA